MTYTSIINVDLLRPTSSRAAADDKRVLRTSDTLPFTKQIHLQHWKLFIEQQKKKEEEAQYRE